MKLLIVSYSIAFSLSRSFQAFDKTKKLLNIRNGIFSMLCHFSINPSDKKFACRIKMTHQTEHQTLFIWTAWRFHFTLQQRLEFQSIYTCKQFTNIYPCMRPHSASDTIWESFLFRLLSKLKVWNRNGWRLANDLKGWTASYCCDIVCIMYIFFSIMWERPKKWTCFVTWCINIR